MLRTVATTALASLLLLTACGGGSDEPSGTAPKPTAGAGAAASSSPTPERVRTVAELTAALPRSSQVPTGDRKIGSCPGDDSCQADTASVTIELTRPVGAQEQERLAAEEFSRDFVQVTATAGTDEAAPQTTLATIRDRAARYVGAFDLPATKTSDTTYTPAEKGEGTLDDVTLEGWKGFVSARDVTFADPEGEGATHPYQSTQVHLVKGTTLISCYVTVMTGPRGAGAATEMARQLATDYIQRLG
ncbi:hypothetical protein [Aeromicrobium sp. Root472D3]|uniref:hypothetical protein n=1 Tax=Aeromicrobium sp. Root472D3 TaxID=1736540 RepID=UPI0006F64EC1|nr:hypothetical protein [Aeromicrobium sp. Root472D3]KQX75042.1 hypothetical protein ASD10_07505 [Aeromicrobium sp. Root472D3]